MKKLFMYFGIKLAFHCNWESLA